MQDGIAAIESFQVPDSVHTIGSKWHCIGLIGFLSQCYYRVFEANKGTSRLWHDTRKGPLLGLVVKNVSVTIITPGPLGQHSERAHSRQFPG